MSQSRGKITTNESFLTATSTHWVTLVRLALIVLPCFASFASFSEWLYNPFFLSVLIRPHQCLSQLEEAHAIRTLASNASSTRTFSSYYVANDSVRIPPLAIAFFSPFLETTSNPELWLALFLLVVDFSIAYLLEQVGTRLLGLLSSCESPASSDDDDNDDNNNDDDNTRNKRFKQSQRPITEEELQQKLPESIRPPFSNIFPIYRHNKSSSDGTVAKQDSSCLSKSEQTPLIPMTSLPLLAAQLYYWSPFTALPACLYSCWQNVPTLFLVASIDESVRYSSSDGSLSMSSFYLAAAAYLEPHHVVYALPIVLVLLSVVGTGFTGQQQQQPEHGLTNVRPIAFFVLCFGVWSVLLQGVSCSLVGPSNYWKVARSIYGNTWLTTSPNLSLQWYFRMQVFARFRDYFGAIFALVPYVLMGPIGLRFQRYPEVQFAMWTMVWTIYRPVQVLFDMNVALCFFLFSPRSLARMGYGSVIALCCIPVPLFLNIVDHWMWLDANNGNANYIFFQCLAHNVFLGIILGQFTSASMKRDKALRLTYRKEVSEETKETKKGSN